RATRCIAIVAKLQYRQIWLWLMVLGQSHRILDGSNRSTHDPYKNYLCQTVHAASVRVANRIHLDNLAINQLDPVPGAEDPGLAHLVVLLGCEAVPLALGRRAHDHLALDHCV